MWFKNLVALRLAKKWPYTTDEFERLLAAQQFTPCNSSQMTSIGWTPRVEHGPLVTAVNRQIYLQLSTEKKLLPASVIAQFAKARAGEIEEQQGFRPGRKQMKEIKETVADELLPRAFSLTSITKVWIDPVNSWICIDAGTTTKSDMVLKMLLKSLDARFQPENVQLVRQPVTAMTDWLLSDHAPDGFTVDQDSELKSPSATKAAVRYVNQSLSVDDARKHIESGKRCTKLAMTWNDRISFILTDNLILKRLQPMEILAGEVGAPAADDQERFEGDFTLMAGELNSLLHDVHGALGGIAPAAVAPELPVAA